MDTNQAVDSGINYQVQAMKALAKELPLNDFGLPTGIYRVDLLPFHNYIPQPVVIEVAAPAPAPEPNTVLIAAIDDAIRSVDGAVSEGPEDDKDVDPLAGLYDEEDEILPSLGYDEALNPIGADGVVKPVSSTPVEYRVAGFLAKDLQSAFVPLGYDEGFPTFDSGQSFWHQLDNEPSDAYRAFEAYLRMSQGRAPNHADEEDAGSAAQGSRSIADMVALIHPNADDAKLLMLIDTYHAAYHIYYWGFRTRAYDLFRVVQYQKRQEVRAIETQDEHYIDARKMRHRIMQYIGSEEEFWDLMTPKVAIEFLKQVTMLERISAGIPATGPMQGREDNSGQSFEVAFRTVAQGNIASSEGTVVDGDGTILDHALEDPDTTKILQELIIRRG